MNKSKIPYYTKNIESFQSQLAVYKRKHSMVSSLRLIVFVGVIVSLTYLVTIQQTIGIFSGFICIIAFVLLLRIHIRIEERMQYLQRIIEINENERSCCLGDFSSFDPGEVYVDYDHRYAYDIDLFGDGSLFQYVNRTVTGKGRSTLSRWLSSGPLSAKTILAHQSAIQELQPLVEFRQDFMTRGSLYKSESNEEDLVEGWLQSTSFFTHKKISRVFMIAAPIFTLTVLGCVIGGQLPLFAFVFLFVTHLFIIGRRLKMFNKRYQLITQCHQILKTISKLMFTIEKQELTDAHLLELKGRLERQKISASQQIKQLTYLMSQLDNRNNLLIGTILNGLFYWDWHCMYRIESWQANHQLDFSQWLDGLADFDALMSLANLSFNNNDYCFPAIVEDEFTLKATELGHPLLQQNQRVCNDFNISESPRYVILTGANMAGKSTFLRTIACNYVLAGSGAAVCAQTFTFYPSQLYTSMRAEDSLIDGESYFFAELKRLKKITEALDQDGKILIILDEILRGTNSEDKRKGSIGFIEKITRKMAYGIVATHDLALARLTEEKPDIFKALCFEVAFVDDQLSFDYKISQGVTKNMNASYLMKSMGIIDQ